MLTARNLFTTCELSCATCCLRVWCLMLGCTLIFLSPQSCPPPALLGKMLMLSQQRSSQQQVVHRWHSLVKFLFFFAYRILFFCSFLLSLTFVSLVSIPADHCLSFISYLFSPSCKSVMLVSSRKYGIVKKKYSKSHQKQHFRFF